MKLNEMYNESDAISTRLKNTIRRTISKFCTFEELLNFETTLLKRIDGVRTRQELINMFTTIKAKKVFTKNLKKVLDK